MIFEVAKIKTPESLAKQAYEAIKECLLQMDLSDPSVEERIDERTLAEQLGVSRTPLREAINRLVVEGFLKVVPRKGVFVVKKTKKEIVEILLVRAALEGLAAGMAAKYVTEEDIEQLEKIIAPFNAIEKIRGNYLKLAEKRMRRHIEVLAQHIDEHMMFSA